MTSPAVTNIARIGRALVTDDEVDGFQQIVYYLAGVGSSSEDSWVAKNYQGLTGTGLLQNVREAYGFLCNNYDYEDEIYITGFSRGAFTARSIAGMVGSVGILTKKGLEHFYEAFDYYENTKKWTAAGKECPVSPEVSLHVVFPCRTGLIFERFVAKFVYYIISMHLSLTDDHDPIPQMEEILLFSLHSWIWRLPIWVYPRTSFVCCMPCLR